MRYCVCGGYDGLATDLTNVPWSAVSKWRRQLQAVSRAAEWPGMGAAERGIPGEIVANMQTNVEKSASEECKRN